MLECASREFAKRWLEMAVGLEIDTSEILNEMIMSMRELGRCDI